MKIIEPKVELWEEDNYISHVARCARVCYKKEGGDDEKTYEHLVENKHISMLRHSTIYAIIHKDNYVYRCIHQIEDVTTIYGIKTIGINIKYDSPIRSYLIVINRQFGYEHSDIIIDIAKYIVSPKEFANASKTAWKMMRYTFCIDTQISTSRELNRVSPNNISEQSTRYVYEDGTLCCPHWLDIKEIDINSIGQIISVGKNYVPNLKGEFYLKKCEEQFANYKYLIEHFGLHRQDARGVLPLDTATRCVYTYSYEEWINILKLRYYEVTGRAHPNAKIIAEMIRNELIELGYDVDKDVTIM